MGRNKSSLIRKYFAFNKSKYESTCKINECGQIMKDEHASNLERHVERCHHEEFLKFKRKIEQDSNVETINKRKTVCLDSTSQQTLRKMFENNNNKSRQDLVIAGCVELVTVNGRPFTLIEDSGFKKIINVINELLPNHSKVNINITKIKDQVNMYAENLKKSIKEEVKNNMICLKIDSATRLDRSLLGINIQFLKDGTIVLRTLGIKELKERHSAAYLKDIILHTLKEFDIDFKQIYTITTDNGANMIKTVDLLKAHEVDEVNENVMEESISEIESDQEDNHINMESVGDELLLHRNNNVLNLVRCWAHTLQLCIDDALKKRMLIIARARQAAKKLRNPTILVLIKKLNLHKPIIDCATRWHSTCCMLERLIELKEFCKDMAPNHSQLFFNDKEWDQLDNIVSGLMPAKIATKKMQYDQLTIGDCYGTWVSCMLETSKINNNISDNIVKSMKTRETKLLDNPAILAGLFLDTRYHVLLSEEYKLRAQVHPQNTWKNLIMINSKPDDEKAPENSFSDSSDREVDELEMYLKSKDNKEVAKTLKWQSSGNMHETNISILLNNYKSEKRLNNKCDILAYWTSQKLVKPELYKLSKIVLAVPCTQVSVERLFSSLKFVFTDYRSNLKEKMLEYILILRANNLFKIKDV